jgi:hypothetical protein
MSDPSLTHHEWELRQEIGKQRHTIAALEAEVERNQATIDGLLGTIGQMGIELTSLRAHIPDPDDLQVAIDAIKTAMGGIVSPKARLRYADTRDRLTRLHGTLEVENE